MKKLEIELYRYESLVFGRVIYQDESLRHRGPIVEKDGFQIGSHLNPALCSTNLFIRGELEKTDNNIFYCPFFDEKTAIKTCKKIVDCVDLINSGKKKQSNIERII